MAMTRFVFVVVVALFHFRSLNAQTCPDGYDGPYDGNYCYKAILTAMTYEEGKETCLRENPSAHLAYATNSAQNDAINDYLLSFRGKADECFISAARRENFFTAGQRKTPDDCDSDEFVWEVSDTETIEMDDFTYWREGEPNCSAGYKENCIAYRCEEDERCYWIDYYCPSRACLLCQIEV